MTNTAAIKEEVNEMFDSFIKRMAISNAKQHKEEFIDFVLADMETTGFRQLSKAEWEDFAIKFWKTENAA